MSAPGLSRVAGLLDRFLALDFSRGRPAMLLAVVFLAVRLPWLWTGYGAETDAYRVALVALHLWRDGEYLPSRLPGYPVHELLMAPIVHVGGSVATNAATALAALAGVLVFARIVRETRQPAPGILVIAFAFTPFLVVNSVAAKDYMWSLTFMLAAYQAAIHKRPFLAGVLLGLGTGCRITTAAFALPLVLLFLPSFGAGKEERDWQSWRRAAIFAGSLAITAFLVFLPVTLQYGTRFWNYANSYISPDIVIRSIGQYSIGALGSLAVLMALALSWKGLVRLPVMIVADVHPRIWLLTLLLYFLAFLRLPIDIAYLIPVYPFAFLLLGRVVNRYLLVGVVAIILFSGMIDLDISAMHNFNMRTFVDTARPCRSCAEYAHDWHVRSLYIHYARDLADTRVPSHSAILTGGAFPDFAVINWNRFRYGVIDRDRGAVSMLSDDGVMRDSSRDVLYLAAPRRTEVLDQLRAQGYRIYKSDPSGLKWDVRLTPQE